MRAQINKISAGISLFFVLFAFSSKAQFNLGVSAGVSTGAVEMQHIDRGFTDVVNGKNITGYEFGVLAKFKAGPVYVKPMVNYTYQSGTVTYQDNSFSYRANKVGIPIMLGLNVIGPLSIEAGPVYNYLVDVTRDYGGYDWQAGKNGLGYRAGLALDFGPLILNASYEGMTYNKTNSDQTGFKEPYKLIFGAAVKFGGGKK